MEVKSIKVTIVGTAPYTAVYKGSGRYLTKKEAREALAKQAQEDKNVDRK